MVCRLSHLPLCSDPHPLMWNNGVLLILSARHCVQTPPSHEENSLANQVKFLELVCVLMYM